MAIGALSLAIAILLITRKARESLRTGPGQSNENLSESGADIDVKLGDLDELVDAGGRANRL
jgi:hypothetical protein